MTEGKMRWLSLALILIFVLGCEKKSSKNSEPVKLSRSDLIDTNWKLLLYTSGKTQDEDLSNFDLSLTIGKDTIGGNGGCNSFGPSREAGEPEGYFVFLEDGTIESRDIRFVGTKKECLESEMAELDFQGALMEAKNFKLNENSLILTGVDYQLVFERMP